MFDTPLPDPEEDRDYESRRRRVLAFLAGSAGVVLALFLMELVLR